jgi:hypothetical protein
VKLCDLLREKAPAFFKRLDARCERLRRRVVCIGRTAFESRSLRSRSSRAANLTE